MKEQIPILIRVSIPQKGFDIDAVDVEIYCYNSTDAQYFFSTKSESFTTIDEETGITAEHGSDSGIFILNPGEHIKIAEVLGWEWDGHVGIELAFRKTGDTKTILKSYNFKSSSGDFQIPGFELMGRIIKPIK